MWIFLNRKREVSNWADSLCFAIIKTPDVSLSNLWTEKGFVFSKISLFANISSKFFLDLVPPWTEIPELLFKTIKSSLLSIIKLSFSLTISWEGWNLIEFVDRDIEAKRVDKKKKDITKVQNKEKKLETA